MEQKFEEIKKKLKENFFGIDEQIEQVINSFETWLSVKEYQTRPMTVCLWGLTGTGKTDLINKTIELLDLDKKKFYVKIGANTSGFDEDIEENNCEDTIFILDEIQKLRTKNEAGLESKVDEKTSTNLIWELLDGGKVNLYGNSCSYGYEKYQMSSLIYALKVLNDNNSKLLSGIITHPNLAKLLGEMHIPLQNINELLEYKEDGQNNCNPMAPLSDDPDPSITDQIRNARNIVERKNEAKFSKTEIIISGLTSTNWYNIFDYVKSRDIDYNFKSKNDLWGYIIDLTDLDKLIKLFEAIRDAKPKIETKNYSKSLIFAIGNLDECFTMSNDLSSDLDAEHFYNKTKKITIVDIRKALLARFRAEEIARLGSTHIIYPSLNKKAFQQIIEKELNSFRKMAIEKFPKKITDVSFSDNIKELIYKEGVFPVIGARSVFSTVNEIISDKFTYVIKKMIELKKEKEVKISFDYNKRKKSININFYNSKNGLIGNENIRYLIKVDGLRTEKDKGKQTHRAVHEAGHAVCSIVLDHIFPEVIYSVVMNAKSSGFNLFNSDDFYYYRKSTYMNRIAGFLAGYAAEEMIFGKDNISNGSSSDIAQATSLLASLFKECGMNGSGILGSYVSTAFATQISDLDYCLIDKDYAIQREIKNSVIKGLELARTTLSEQKLLFLKISEYLSKNPKITNKEIKNLTKKYVSGISMEEINKNKEQFYCDKLNEQLKNLKNNSNE